MIPHRGQAGGQPEAQRALHVPRVGTRTAGRRGGRRLGSWPVDHRDGHRWGAGRPIEASAGQLVTDRLGRLDLCSTESCFGSWKSLRPVHYHAAVLQEALEAIEASTLASLAAQARRFRGRFSGRQLLDSAAARRPKMARQPIGCCSRDGGQGRCGRLLARLTVSLELNGFAR